MCEGHARCTRTALFRVVIHRIDRCNTPKSSDAIYALCSACTRAAAYRLGEIIGEMYEEMPDDDKETVLRCKPCRRPINELHDVFSVEWMKVSA